MSMSKVISKVGIKLCFPDVPSDWVGATADSIEARQNYLPKRLILNNPKTDSDADAIEVKLEDYEDDEKYCFYRRRYRYIQRSGNKYGGFSWSYDSEKLKDLFFMRYNFHPECPWSSSIKEGTSFDVISMLSRNSNCLIQSNGERVDIETCLKGKNVLVCCFQVPLFWNDYHWPNSIRGLSTHYSVSKSKGGEYEYEMVIVAKMLPNWVDDEDAFSHFLSAFPSSCLAIPFEDTLGRTYVCDNLGFETFPVGLFVDNNQKVVYHEVLLSGGHGFDIYPITPLLFPGSKCPCVEPLTHLDSFVVSDFVYKINSYNTKLDDIWGDKVSVSEFKDKLVGVYLCYDGTFIRMLDLISQECQARNQEFQIVMIYFPYRQSVNPHFFMEAINHVLRNLNILSTNSNWWVSPFNDSQSRRIWEYYEHFHEDKLVILDPHTNIADPNGKFVFDLYGIDGYPFTTEVIVNKKFEAVRATTLESWLVYGSRDYVLRMNFNDDFSNVDKVPVAELRGKIVLVYVCELKSLYSKYYDLLDWYAWNKTTRLSDFDVVIVGLDEHFLNSMRTPWLVCPYEPQHAAFVRNKILKGRYDILAAFGKDGQIITSDALDLLNSYGPKGFPSFEWYRGLRNELIQYLDDCDDMEYVMEFLD